MKSLIIISLLILICVAKEDKCYAITFQDGGDMCAYEAGVFQGLMSYLEQDKTRYQVVTGVSFGGVNAAILDQTPIGQEVQAASEMINFWQSNNHVNVYRSYLGGVIQSMIYESSIYSTEPLKTTFTQQFAEGKHYRKINIGAVDVDTAQYQHWDESYEGQDWVDAMMASTAIPTLYPYQTFEGATYFYGGIVHHLDIAKAIDRCHELGYEDQDIVVDSIFTAGQNLGPWTGKENTLQANERDQKMKQFLGSVRDYIQTREAYPNVHYRCTVKPIDPLPDNDFMFAFNSAAINELIDLGLQDAKIIAGTGNCTDDAGQKIIKDYYTRILVDMNKPVTDENINAQRKLHQEAIQMVKKLKGKK